MAVTVTTPPAEPVLTLAEAKAHLRVDTSDEDTLITGLVAAAGARAETFLRVSLITQSLTLTGSALRSPICLARGPVQSITAITYTDPDGATQTLAADQYRLITSDLPEKIIPATGVVWPLTLGEPDVVAVEYVAGHGDEPGDLPADIRAALFMIVGHLYENREEAVTGTIATRLPSASVEMLTPHIRWV